MATLAHLLLVLVPSVARADEHPGGFWKCRPPSHVKGAFGNEDPVGLAARSHVTTDCELHWSDGHGTTYCFATPPSLLLFKDDPDGILRAARAFWDGSHTRK